MTPQEILLLIQRHEFWLERKPGGGRANLSGMNLSGFNLANINLQPSNFTQGVG